MSVIQYHIECYRVLYSNKACNGVLWSVIEHHGVSKGIAVDRTLLQSLTEYCIVLWGTTEHCRVLHGVSGYQTVLQSIMEYHGV